MLTNCGVGIDLAAFQPVSELQRAHARHDLGLPSPHVVHCMGRLAHLKGQHLLVAAWERQRPPDTVLLLLGPGDPKPLRDLAPTQWRRTVLAVGGQDDVRPWLWASDLLLMPSRYETIGLCVAEAMACGVPVVATAVNGVREMVGSGEAAGGVAPVGDIGALLSEAARRLADPCCAGRRAPAAGARRGVVRIGAPRGPSGKRLPRRRPGARPQHRREGDELMNDRRIPTFLVAGAARSGTTGLVEGLRSNPGVFVTSPKEPHYFALHGQRPDFRAPGDAQTINSVAVTDREAYLGLYPPSSPHVALGDASVSTLYYHERALPEIRDVNPNMRVVVLLREPVARAYSSHQYLRARGFEPCEDFLAAVADEPRRRAENWHHIWHYTGMSRYSDAVAAMQAQLPPENVRVWFYDDLERDFAGTVTQVLRFIGAPPVPGEGEQIPRVNTSGKPRFEQVQRAIWWATRHEALRSGVKQVTSFRFRERVRRMTLRREGPPPEAYARLQPLFADDVARLRTLVPGPHPAWLAAA